MPPPKYYDEKFTALTISISKEQKEQLDALVRKLGDTRSAIVRRAIHMLVQSLEEKKWPR